MSFCRAKLFLSLIEKLPVMFPQDILVTEINQNELRNEFYLKIKVSTREEIDRKRESAKERRRLLELHKYI